MFSSGIKRNEGIFQVYYERLQSDEPRRHAWADEFFERKPGVQVTELEDFPLQKQLDKETRRAHIIRIEWQESNPQDEENRGQEQQQKVTVKVPNHRVN